MEDGEREGREMREGRRGKRWSERKGRGKER